VVTHKVPGKSIFHQTQKKKEDERFGWGKVFGRGGLGRSEELFHREKKKKESARRKRVFWGQRTAEGKGQWADSFSEGLPGLLGGGAGGVIVGKRELRRNNSKLRRTGKILNFPGERT